MKKSEIVSRLMFDWDEFSKAEIVRLCKKLNKKTVRWIGINHPDNKTRKIFLELTGVRIGKDTVINPYCVFSDNYSSLIEIGSRCAVAPCVNFIAVSEPNNSKLRFNDYVKTHLIKSQKIVVGDDVWIGANVTILPGINIGKGAVIGANSVVVKDIPPYTIVAGCPARTLKEIK